MKSGITAIAYETIKDARGNLTQYLYDGANRKTSEGASHPDRNAQFVTVQVPAAILLDK